jgi:thiol-disulfide isomerase/thioredoxin
MLPLRISKRKTIDESRSTIMFRNNLGLMPLILLSTVNMDLAAQVPDQNGKNHPVPTRNAEFTVIYFVARKSKACRKSIPMLETLSKRFDTVSFRIISIDEKRKDYLKLLQRTGVTLPVIRDENNTWTEKFQPEDIPALFLIDPDGKVVYSHTGYNKPKWEHFTKYMEETIKKILYPGRK